MKRTDKLESYLKDKVTLNFSHPSKDKMSIVDRTGTNTTFVEFFFDMASGDFPEDKKSYSKPPTQGMFATAFFSHHKKQGANRFTDEFRECWRRRCEVTYPSLVRDMHFAYMMIDYNLSTQVFDSVQYDPEKDVKEGADAIVRNNNDTYYINLYVDTKKSNAYLDEKKNHRHPNHENKEIHFPIDKHSENCKTIELADGNDIWLYDKSNIERIKDIILKSPQT